MECVAVAGAAQHRIRERQEAFEKEKWSGLLTQYPPEAVVLALDDELAVLEQHLKTKTKYIRS